MGELHRIFFLFWSVAGLNLPWGEEALHGDELHAFQHGDGDGDVHVPAFQMLTLATFSHLFTVDVGACEMKLV